MKNGACYIRVSTDKQEELSPDAQRRLLLDYAKKNDIIIASDYIYTEAISGRQASKRPEFQRMIAAAKSEEHPIDVILVWKYSRFARNQEESIVYKSLLKKQCSVDVISVSEPLVDGPFGSLIERIIEWMDEYYSIRLSGEVMRGMTEKARRGGYQATTPLGYRYNGSGQVPTVLDEEAEIVRFIYSRYADFGDDRTTIARKLNDMGKHTKRGGLFEKRNIEYILKNPFYLGKVRWNRAPHSAYQENPEDEIIVADGQHPAIIDHSLFERAQARLKAEFAPRKARSVSTCKHWLSGLLKCPICGASLSYCRPAKSFQCWKYAKGFHEGSCSLSESKATAAVLSGIKELLDGKEFTYEYRPPKAPSNLNRASVIEDELRRISSREQRIKLAYENGIDSLEEYGDNKRRIREDRQRLEEELRLTQEKESFSPPSKSDVLARIQNVYDMISDDSVDYVTKGTLMREIFSEIVYDRDSSSFVFRIVVS